ncbi:MAG: hypothetical protein JWQ27_404 [Ferruginibacter sp.]|nr:hypothetical protein [Ferruginibacter sp.]
MKRLIILIVILLAGFSVYWFMLRTKSNGPKAPKQEAIAAKNHSDSFNTWVNGVVSDYLMIKDALVEADTAAAKASTTRFIAALDSIKTDEIKKDTAMMFETFMATVGDMKSNAASLLVQTDITEMRKDFSSLTDMMYPAFFKAVAYEGPKLYLQNCPMAFNDEVPANWISANPEVINPYLGKKHPKYHAGMLNCGEVKDSIVAQ